MIELPIKTCKLPRCGEQFRQKRPDQEFCSGLHRREFWSQAAQRARSVYPKLMDWRKTRGKAKGLLGDIAAEVDQWIAEDKEKSRG